MGTFFTTHRPGHSQPPKLKQGPGASRPNTRKSFSADQARYVAARSVASPGTTRRAKFWRRSRHKTKRKTPNTEHPMFKSEANPADVATIDSIITAATTEFQAQRERSAIGTANVRCTCQVRV